MNRLIASLRTSANPLSTAAGYAIAYLYVNQVTLPDIQAFVSALGWDDLYNYSLALAMVLIGHSAGKGGTQ